MMASRPFAPFPAQRGLLDVSVAALAGIAVAFAALAAPADLLGRAVEATGLPDLLSAAAPPLGLKARLAIGLVGALAVSGCAYLLLRWLDRLSTRPVRAAPVLAVEPEAPRLRRRDLHPDAPPRPPISATREFGEPAPPRWMAPECVAEIVAPEPESEPEPEPEAPALLPPREETIAALMARLEEGLARRAAAAPAPPRPAPPPTQPQVFPEADDDRLQSAIESLQRLAARRD
jgi:hypothetical protein